MAQRIEHLTTDQKVGGLNPSGRAERNSASAAGFRRLEAAHCGSGLDTRSRLNAVFLPAISHTIGPTTGKQRQTTIQITLPTSVRWFDLRIDSKAKTNMMTGTTMAKADRMAKESCASEY